MERTGTVTEILKQARGGDRTALDQLYALLYGELREIAHGRLASSPPDATLRTTALVNEAWLRMAGQERLELEDRAHFLAYASRVMRTVLVDQARRLAAEKRGGGAVHVELLEQDLAIDQQVELLLALDEALTRLASFAERACRVVECRYFGGLTEEETAEALGVSNRTVRRDWKRARAWLYQALASGGDAVPRWSAT